MFLVCLLHLTIQGHWVDRSKFKFAANVYVCSRQTCIPATPEPGCWERSSYDQAAGEEAVELRSCDAEELQCSEGAQGPLCGSCAPLYVFSSEVKTCRLCSESGSESFLLVGVVGVCVVLIAFAQFSGASWIQDSAWVRLLQSIDSGSLKVVWVTYQIVSREFIPLRQIFKCARLMYIFCDPADHLNNMESGHPISLSILQAARILLHLFDGLFEV